MNTNFKLPPFLKPEQLLNTMLAMAVTSIIFAYLQRHSPALRDLLKTTP